jgi:TATA-binding protein-associated factor
MGLQKFKILTANTVVSVENQTMETMGTDQLLDLFNLSEEDEKAKKQQSKSSNSSMKNILEVLPELWDNSQYEEQYDISTFIESLGTNPN